MQNTRRRQPNPNMFLSTSLRQSYCYCFLIHFDALIHALLLRLTHLQLTTFQFIVLLAIFVTHYCFRARPAEPTDRGNICNKPLITLPVSKPRQNAGTTSPLSYQIINTDKSINVLPRMFIHSLFPLLNFMLLKFTTPHLRGLADLFLTVTKQTLVEGNYPTNHVCCTDVQIL